jgi:adenosylhomocysteinase
MTVTTAQQHDVKDLALADEGVRRIEWADRTMPVLRSIRDRFASERPLEGLRISACLHVTTETANLMRTLVAGGADVVLCASNPLSTQDDVAAALVRDYGTRTYAIKDEDNDTYYAHIMAAVEHRPHITMDDGADVVGILHGDKREYLEDIIGGTEETTTGVIRLRALKEEGKLAFPIVAVNDSQTKHMFDNRYGTGQSTVDGIVRATNLLLAGKNFVVAGYGWCGRGLATRAKGLGANVIVTEVDPLRALEAAMDGFQVMPMEQAARVGHFFVTATGNKHVLRREHYELMRDGAVLANTGHFNVEIDIPALEELSTGSSEPREFVRAYHMGDGRRLNLLADGRLINLASAEGHPASVMDMSFANQALGLEWLIANREQLDNDVYTVPAEIDAEIAKLKLAAEGLEIDDLTPAQVKYLASWDEGTE